MIGSLPCVLDIPVVETERLRLRGHTLDDFPHTRALWGDAAVVTYMGGKPLTLEECWTRFLRYRGHWSVLGFGYWVVEEKATGDFVGEVGFGDFKRDRSRQGSVAMGTKAFCDERLRLPHPPRSSSLDQGCQKVRLHRRTPWGVQGEAGHHLQTGVNADLPSRSVSLP
jgi:hypothetical protein